MKKRADLTNKALVWVSIASFSGNLHNYRKLSKLAQYPKRYLGENPGNQKCVQQILNCCRKFFRARKSAPARL